MRKPLLVKFAALFLVLLISCLALSVPTLALEPGDMDGDAKVTAKDARFVLRLSARLETASDAQKASADADEDGKITAKDARIILRVSAKLTTFEHEQAVAQKRKQLEALGPEANIFMFGETGWYDGEALVGPPQEFADTVVAWNEYASYQSYRYAKSEDLCFARLDVGDKAYLVETGSKVCVELNRKNAEVLGIELDDEGTAEPLPEPDIERLEIMSEEFFIGKTKRLRTTITHPDVEWIETYITEGDTLIGVTVTDKKTGELLDSIEIWNISDTVPDGLLDLGSYHVCADAYDFLRRLG